MGAPLPLIELYIAKKCLVFLAARAYGFKPLYRRCLEFNDRLFAPRSKTNGGFRWAIRHSFDAALKAADWADAKARGTVVRVTGKEPPADAAAAAAAAARTTGAKPQPKKPPMK